MRRILLALAGALLLLGLVEAPGHGSEATMHSTGDGSQGEFWDYHFYAVDHEVYAWWAANAHPALDPADKVWNSAYLSRVEASHDVDGPVEAADLHTADVEVVAVRVPSQAEWQS